MDGLSVNGYIACFTCHHNQCELMTSGGSGTFQQTTYFTIVQLGLGSREIISHLYELCDAISVQYGKIDFVTFMLAQIEELLGVVL